MQVYAASSSVSLKKRPINLHHVYNDKTDLISLPGDLSSNEELHICCRDLLALARRQRAEALAVA